MDLTGDPSVGVSMECDGISERIQPCRFSNVIAGWAVGGNVCKMRMNQHFMLYTLSPHRISYFQRMQHYPLVVQIKSTLIIY